MLTDIFEINQKKLQEIYSFGIRNGSTVLVFGTGGIGKTEIAKQMCRETGMQYRYLNLSVLEAPDLIGLPREHKGKTVYAPPEFLPLIEDGGDPIVLIVDELDKAKDEVESPMLELFQYRSVNGRPVNIQAIIATGNLPNEKAKSRLVSHVLANRCLIYKLECNFKPWREWAVAANVNPLVIGFLNARPEYLLKPNESNDPTAYCHPTPRAWTLGGYELDAYLKEINKFSNSDEITDYANDPVVDFGFVIMAGRVGKRAALEFKVWLKHYRQLQPVIDALLETGQQPPKKLTSDQVIIVAMSAMSKLKEAALENDLDSVGTWVPRIFEWMMEDHIPPDICLAAARAVLNKQLVEQIDILKYPVVSKVFLTKIKSMIPND